MKPIVSIIIPIFNRVHLIEETLTSILKQSFTDWECIIIDDGSTDNTIQVIEEFVKNDSRFRVYRRPSDRPKGANVCRNIGIEKAKGTYFQFFDSDDLMSSNMLKEKVALLIQGQYDYVISKTANFQHPDITTIIDSHERFYTFDKYQINNINYVSQRINWLTPDFIGKSYLFKDLRFNQKLQSGQEYNLFSKLTLKNENASVLDSYTTLRRMHDTSTRAVLNNNVIRLLDERSLLYKETYIELKKANASKEVLNTLLKKTCVLYLQEIPSTRHLFFVFKGLTQMGRFKHAIAYTIYQISAVYLKKGYFLRKRLMQSL